MRFKGRELPPFAEPLVDTELKEGNVYFSVDYADTELLIPTMEAVVFIGRDLQPGDAGQVYFQDVESYRRGVRFEAATENDYAKFSTGSAKEVSHFFEYERALEELMRCFVRRGERGRELTPHFRGPQASERPAQDDLDGLRPQSLRFDDAGIQAFFIAELRKASLAFKVREDGAVVCMEADWPLLNTVAHAIRDSCFRWYFLFWKDQERAYRFWQEIKASGLPFQVEHHGDRILFLLPKGSEDLHQTIVGRVQGATVG